jgi:hypothetical protein
MARKNSETPQGDGAPEPKAGSTPEPMDEAAGLGNSETAPVPDPPSEPRPEPWDPEIVPPEAEGGDAAPVEPLPDALAEPAAPGVEPVPPAAREAPPFSTTSEPGEPDDALAMDTAADREEAAREVGRGDTADSVPVVDSSDEPGEEAHEEEAGWSFAARALAVLLLLLAGAGLGIWAAPKVASVLPSGMAPIAAWLTPGQATTEAEVAALRDRLDADRAALEGRFAALPAGDEIDARIRAAVGETEARLATEIEAAKAAAGEVDMTEVNRRLGDLEAALQGQTTELAALKDQIAGTAGQLSEEALGRIDAYKGEVEALRGEMGSVRDAVSGFATRLDEVEGRAGREIDAAQARVDEIRQQADTELSAAGLATEIARIRAAIASGQPFAEPLAALTDQASATVPEGLAASAGSGVATLAELRDGYADAAHAAVRASIMARAEGGGLLSRTQAFVEAQVSSRSLTPQTGQGTDAVLSRIEDRLREDDLQGVLAEAENLPSEAAAAMGEWLADARARAAAVDGLSTLDASLTKTN